MFIDILPISEADMILKEKGDEVVKRGNVLVVGNLGVGKSTLIDAVLGDEQAKYGWGLVGKKDAISVHEEEGLPFRLIDTLGFDASKFKQRQVLRELRRWLAANAKKSKGDNRVDVLWLCLDGTANSLFQTTIEELLQATDHWGEVPIVAVINKSYSLPEREKNTFMVKRVFSREKFAEKRNLADVIPVVAAPYAVSESTIVAPEGIAELIDVTNKLLPVPVQAREEDLELFKLKRKRALANGVVASAVALGVVVGAVPIPFPDSAILVPMELAMIRALARIYAIPEQEDSKALFNALIDAGAVAFAAKAAIKALKSIPGIRLGVSAINAIVAGGIVAALGQGTTYIFEQIHLGKRDASDLGWVKRVLEGKFAGQFSKALAEVVGRFTDEKNKESMAQIILDVVHKYWLAGEQEDEEEA